MAMLSFKTLFWLICGSYILGWITIICLISHPKKKCSLYRIFTIPDRRVRVRAESYRVDRIDGVCMVTFFSHEKIVCTIFCETVPDVYTYGDMYPQEKGEQND